MKKLINKISFLIIPLGFIYFACEDKVAEEKLVVDSFDITLVDKITTVSYTHLRAHETG